MRFEFRGVCVGGPLAGETIICDGIQYGNYEHFDIRLGKHRITLWIFGDSGDVILDNGIALKKLVEEYVVVAEKLKLIESAGSSNK
jgi:hypothetical protein